MSTKRLLTGNEAVAWGAARAGAQVVAAYPITPQTTIIEQLASLVQKGISKAKYIPVESEHSAMAHCIGAAHAGARAFTATSSQGLALMHELLHWAAAARLPIVLADVNRAMAPGWSIWTDQNDSLSQRDTGWIQLYCEDAQEVIDSTIQAFAIAAHTSLPVMVVLEAFVLSHTAEAVFVPGEEEISHFIPRWDAPWKINLDRPQALGGLVPPAEYEHMRHAMAVAHRQALGVVEEVAAQWRTRFGRGFGLIEPVSTAQAETILLTSGTVTSTARQVIQEMRGRGAPVGLVKVRTFRPFPVEALRAALSQARRVVVIDRNCSYGASGIFYQELRAALCGVAGAPAVHGYIAGMGGRDVTPSSIRAALRRALEGEAPHPESVWLQA